MEQPRPRVLVVDDSPSARYTRTRLLERAGLDVREAATGEESLRAVIEFRPEVVVLDINLPDLDGLDVCRRIKADANSALVQVLHLTATALTSEALARGLEIADGYLVEPVEPQVLVSHVKALIRSHRALKRERDTHARLELALAAGGLGTWEMDLVGNWVTASDAVCRMFGFERARPRFEDWAARVHPEDRQRVTAAFSATVSAGADYDVQYRTVLPEGVRWVHARGKVLRDRGGMPERIIGVAQDITTRMQAEEQLGLLTRRLEAHLQNTPAMVVEYAPDFTIIRWSPECERVFGWKAEEVAGKNLSHLRWVYDEDVPAIQRIVTDMLEGGARQNISLNRNYRKDGSVVWCEWYNSALHDGSGRLQSVLCFGLNVTERKRVQDALQESEQKYKSLAENLPAVLMRYDRQSRVVYMTPNVEEITGRPAGAFIGRTNREAGLPEELCARWENALEIVVQTGCNQALEFDFPTPRGRATFYLTLAPEFGAGGTLTHVLGIFTDITARKRAEEALGESERQFRTLANAIPQLCWMANPDGATFWYNERWYQYTGATPAQMEGWGWQSVHAPETLPAVLERWKKSLATGEPFDMVFPLRGADGVFRPFLTRVMPVRDSEGRIVRWFGTNTDISEQRAVEQALRKSEQSLARAQELAHLGNWELEIATHELYWSDEVYRIFGIPPQALPPSNALFFERVHPEDRERIRAAVADTLHRGTPYNLEHRICLPGGAIRTVQERAELIRGASGEPVRFVGTVLDITERKAAEEHLRQAQKMESIGLLAGGIAHDFNNLLTGVLGNASLILEGMTAWDPNRAQMGDLVRSAERAADLTRQLLAYAGKGRFVVAAVNLSTLTGEISTLLRGSISKGVELKFLLEDGLPPVEADPGQLQQVVMNLVLNAAEAIGERAGRIVLRTRTQTVDESFIESARLEIATGVYVCLDVQDTGCGMDRETMAKIFEPFFTTKFTGRGLGLAAVQGVVKAHNGAITVYSRPGQGSLFSVLLPAAAGSVSRKAEITANMQDLSGHGTVLVADDEETVRSAAKTILEHYGYRVLLAGDGAEALAIFGAIPDQVTLVLLDLSMPGLSGEETLNKMREVRPDLRVLLSSGYNQIEAIRRFSVQGISGFIGKPYSAATLATKVKAACAGAP